MKYRRMEKYKFYVDIGVTTFTLLAAICAILSFYFGAKLDIAKKIEENRFRLKIAESNATAEKAKEEAAKAKEEAANAFSSAASTNAKSKILEIQLESQKERANNSEKELLLLKDRIKPRTLSKAQTDLLISELKKFSKKEIHISSSIGDGEALSYAEEFGKIFEEAGWEVTSTGLGMSILTGVGTYLLIKDQNVEGFGDAKKLFLRAGIELKLETFAGATKMQLFIGSKTNNESNN